jgi:phosphoserine phosphatase RsbU/P
LSDVSIHPDLVKAEFDRSTEKFHVIACWVGIVLNLLWFASDYFILPAYWIPFLIFRACVSGITFLLLVTKKITGFSIYTVIFVLVLGISVQNAYMWSVMDLAHLQKHTLAYIALFIGVGMLVLWEVWYSVILVVVTIISNIVFYKLFSPLTVDEFLTSGGLLTLTVAIFCIFLIRTRNRMTMNEIKMRLELEKSKDIIEEERNIVARKNQEITDSINYASRIQKAVFPSETDFTKHFTDCFVLFKPKDIVSGDFYWICEKNEKIFYVTADCTGHGVPGGFVTMLGLSFLEEIVHAQNVTQPAQILNVLREKIINSSKASHEESQDGMDVVVCSIDRKNRVLDYACANNSFFVLRNGDIIELKADKQPCGLFFLAKPFTPHTFKLEKGDYVYTFTDGYADQFGGPLTRSGGKKFRYKQFEELLMNNYTRPGWQQRQILDDSIERWKGNFEQVDDILVIGVRID